MSLEGEEEEEEEPETSFLIPLLLANLHSSWDVGQIQKRGDTLFLLAISFFLFFGE